ncbi:MAG: CsgG/HfaB family protein [Longimicrobiales bacterium]|nr:CsgG/HfaB family protein [Longimicrobiales bacterium]
MSRRLILILAVAPTLALISPLPAPAQDPSRPATDVPAPDTARVPTVAVFDFTTTALTGEDGTEVGRALAAMMTTELAARPAVRVVDRQQVRRLIETRQLALSGRMDEARAVELAKLLGAEYSVVGSVWLEPSRVRIDLRLLDTATGTVERASKQQGPRDEVLDLVTAVADAFTHDLELPARSGAAAPDPPAGAVLAYSRGLDYERRGMDGRAVEMYRRALELFPRYEAAAAALRRMGGGSR